MTNVVNQNYVSNPSFKDGFNGWGALDATLVPLSLGGNYGPECLKVVKDAQEYSGVQSTRLSSINTRGTSNTYTASAYAKIPSGEQNGTLYVSIIWFTAGKSKISESNSTGSALSNGGDWTRISVTATPPANARYAAVRIAQFTIGSAGESFLVDAVRLEVGTTATEFRESVDQSEENAIVNRGLTKVPFPQITGLELNADIELDDLVLNTIDQDGFVWVVTDIKGLFEQPDVEFPTISRGYYADGDYDVKGRYQARNITLNGTILVPDRTYVSEARDKLVRAMDLVRRGAWLRLKAANEPVKAVFVRLSGKPDTEVVSARGRIDFSIGLKAADPIIYEWNEDRVDGYSLAQTYASNYTGSQSGSVDVENLGNYSVPVAMEIRGPVYSTSASIFNVSNGDLMGLNATLDGEKYRPISQKEMTDFIATLKFTQAHGFVGGEEITVSLLENFPITQVDRGSGNTYATLTTTEALGIANGDKVILTGVGGSLDGSLLDVSNVTSTTFTVQSSNTSAYSNTSLTSATALDYTNKLFNGTQYVSSVPNAFAVTYSVDYRETVAQVAVNAQSTTYFKNLVYKDADYLEIDTLNREVALNGQVGLNRGRLDPIVDWVRLAPGVNTVEFDDSNQQLLFVEKRTILANGLATVFTSTPHGLVVGDNIHVAEISADYDTPETAIITQFSRSGTTANLTATSHPFSNNDTVIISNVSRGVDGQYLVANATANTFTVTTETVADSYPVQVKGRAKKIYPVTQYSKSNNTVVLTVTNSFSAGTTIYVSDVHEDLDGQVVLTAANTTTVTYDTRIRVAAGKIPTTMAGPGAQIVRRYPVVSNTEYSITYNTGKTGLTPETNTTFGMLATTGYDYHAISSITRGSNVATATTKDKHGFSVGDFVDISGGVNSTFQVGYGDPKAITSYKIRGANVTMNVASHGLTANDTVSVLSVDTGLANVSIVGTYTVNSIVDTNNFTYTIDSNKTLSYDIASGSLTSNIVTLALVQTPKFKLTDELGAPTKITVTGATGSSAPMNIDNATLLSFDANTKSVRYALTNTNIVNSTTNFRSAKVSLSWDKTPERGRIYRRNEVVYYSVNDGSSLNSQTAGNVAYLVFRTAHGLVSGDTVDVLNLSSVINGPQVVDTVVDTRTITIKNVAVTTLVSKNKTGTAARAVNSNLVTITSTGHGREPGDWIYFIPNATDTAALPEGKYQIVVKVSADAFKFRTTGVTTLYNATRAHTFYPLSESAYAIRAYPILDSPAPTDYNFSYRNPVSGAADVAPIAVDTSGELARNSDGKLRIFYRSGWIG